MDRRPDWIRNSTDHLRRIWKPALVLWGLFLAIWLFSARSRLGFQTDAVGLSWGPAGAPVTFLQVLFIFFLSMLLAGVWHFLNVSTASIPSLIHSHRDTWIAVALWAAAVVLWSNQPAPATHFSPPPMPPNNETYPNSDALLFDKSSYHLLYGAGFSDNLTRRPLYVGMLAVFHAIVGGSYDDTVFLQILLLALIPALIYLLTSNLFNRLAGLIAGGMIVVREWNSIVLSGEIVTSHAKLMMSDMMATLGVVLFMYLAIVWFKKREPDPWQAVIVGACLGLTALVRAQVLVLFAPLVLLILLTQRPIQKVIRNSMLAFLGIVLVMTPWAWRNWNLTGTFVLDDRGEERLLARNYSLTPTSLPAQLPGESEEEFSARLKQGILTFVIEHPGDVLHFVSNHFLRNLATASVYIAPAYSTASSEEIIQHLPFWNDWMGNLTRNSAVALFLNLGVIALGVTATHRRNKWIGIFPLIVFLIYSLGNALVRSSGWRFNQPVDWMILVYYSIALAYLPSIIRSSADETAKHEAESAPASQSRHVLPSLLLALILIGASVPIAERLIPSRTFDIFNKQAMTRLADESTISVAELDSFLEQEEAVLLSGVALYPRFVQPNSRFRPGDVDGEYKYLHLWLINEGDYEIILPLQVLPDQIPHTATLSVIGCREQGYISAWAIVVHEPGSHVLLRDPGSLLRCPLKEPSP